MKLKVIQGATPGRVFEVIEGLNVLGRLTNSSECNVIDLSTEDIDEKVSRKHAMIEKSGSELVIWDLGSLNGTFVNSPERLEVGQQCHLKPGDQVIIGKTALVVEGV